MIKKQNIHRAFGTAALILSAVVCFTTVYFLMLPAITLEKEKAEAMPGISLDHDEEVKEEDLDGDVLSDEFEDDELVGEEDFEDTSFWDDDLFLHNEQEDEAALIEDEESEDVYSLFEEDLFLSEAETETERGAETETEEMIEPVTETEAESITEAGIVDITEAVTEVEPEEITETVTEAETEEITEAVTEAETGKITEAETKELFPEQSFKESTSEIIVCVSAPAGAFPAGTTMQVEDIDDTDTLDAITESVEKSGARPEQIFRARNSGCANMKLAGKL